jgi:predicted GIY-YIG superfamily endonuclease
MTNIYILRLEGGKYYVGKSEDVINRFSQHINGYGSFWTRKYKPISLEKIIENASPFDEDKITKEYMSKYGIDNVRGGSYVEIELSEFHKRVLKMEIWGATDLCTQCGRAGHFVKDCYAKTKVSKKNQRFLTKKMNGDANIVIELLPLGLGV